MRHHHHRKEKKSVTLRETPRFRLISKEGRERERERERGFSPFGNRSIWVIPFFSLLALPPDPRLLLISSSSSLSFSEVGRTEKDGDNPNECNPPRKKRAEPLSVTYFPPTHTQHTGTGDRVAAVQVAGKRKKEKSRTTASSLLSREIILSPVFHHYNGRRLEGGTLVCVFLTAPIAIGRCALVQV